VAPEVVEVDMLDLIREAYDFTQQDAVFPNVHMICDGPRDTEQIEIATYRIRVFANSND
jgi:hypothetical protein